MPQISKQFPHSLGTEEAITRIKSAIEHEKTAKANIISESHENWVAPNEMEYSMKIFGYAVSGTLKITDDNVAVDLGLPTFAVMFKGMIENQMDQEMKQLLS